MYYVISNDKASVRQFGVRGEQVVIEDIAVNEQEVHGLVSLLNLHKVSELHTYDVVQDWYGVL